MARFNPYPTPPGEPTPCPGCGRYFNGPRGLRAHQSKRHITLACKPRVPTPPEYEGTPWPPGNGYPGTIQRSTR